MTFELNELDIDPVSEWIKKIKKIFQESEKKRLSKSKKEYDHVIKLI